MASPSSSDRRPLPADDALWDTWAAATIACAIDGRECCLRGPEAEPLPAAAPIFAITAYNPMGEERELAVNVAAERELERELRSRGLAFWPAIGRSRDGSWSEPGIAVAGLDRDAACEVGGRYGQLAIYELTEDEVYVVRCGGGEVVRSRPRAE